MSGEGAFAYARGGPGNALRACSFVVVRLAATPPSPTLVLPRGAVVCCCMA